MIFTADWRFISSIGVADAATAKAAIASHAERMVMRILADFDTLRDLLGGVQLLDCNRMPMYCNLCVLRNQHEMYTEGLSSS